MKLLEVEGDACPSAT